MNLILKHIYDIILIPKDIIQFNIVHISLLQQLVSRYNLQLHCGRQTG